MQVFESAEEVDDKLPVNGPWDRLVIVRFAHYEALNSFITEWLLDEQHFLLITLQDVAPFHTRTSANRTTQSR